MLHVPKNWMVFIRIFIFYLPFILRLRKFTYCSNCKRSVGVEISVKSLSLLQFNVVLMDILWENAIIEWSYCQYKMSNILELSRAWDEWFDWPFNYMSSNPTLYYDRFMHIIKYNYFKFQRTLLTGYCCTIQHT